MLQHSAQSFRPTRSMMRGSLIAAACLLGASAVIAQPISLTGTANNAPQEVTLPADAQPAFSFKNDTGVEICDFVVGVKTGAGQLTGGLLDDPNKTDEDWDVDDDRSGEIDGTEGSAGAGAEGAGPAALGHADNTQAANRQIRLQEDGWNRCIRVNGNFGVTLTFSPAPAAGDKITVQPTNDVGANIYACKDDTKVKDKSMTLNPRTHLNTKFATACPTVDGALASMTLYVDSPDVYVEWLETEPPSAIAFAHSVDGRLMSATMVFEQPVPEGKSVLIQGELSDFGTISLSGKPAHEDGVDDIDPVGIGNRF